MDHTLRTHSEHSSTVEENPANQSIRLNPQMPHCTLTPLSTCRFSPISMLRSPCGSRRQISSRLVHLECVCREIQLPPYVRSRLARRQLGRARTKGRMCPFCL